MKTRRTRMFLLCGVGALALAAMAMRANGGVEAQASQAPASVASSAPLPANLPAGEIQSVTEHNGGRVIVIKAAQPTETTAAPNTGMRAYIDPTTGRLREVTDEDVRAEAAAAATSRLRARVAVAEPQIIESASGRSVMLDGSQDAFAIAHKDASGAISVEEAVGPEAAANAVARPTPTRKARKEQRHDR